MISHKLFHLSAAVALTSGLQFPSGSMAGSWDYIDDRSTPQKLVQSYYYAISNQLYTQAYSYFSKGWEPKDFHKWSEGYASTKKVIVKFGPTEPDAGAGQINWALPVAISAEQTDGTTKVFVGCYQIHMTNIGMQTDPPYQPMGINSATLKETGDPFDKVTPDNCSSD
ncbi:hypothetical protein ABLO27_03895 [Roseibium sp. SCPC15]|uniref:hypothetical protein n=1 Tax=Roseibium sp. SCP15 TaxID=3141376 RepID=UPI00333C5A68